MITLPLNANVRVSPSEVVGRVVGRTFEQTPRYDVMTRDGRVLSNVDSSRIAPVRDAIAPPKLAKAG